MSMMHVQPRADLQHALRVGKAPWHTEAKQTATQFPASFFNPATVVGTGRTTSVCRQVAAWEDQGPQVTAGAGSGHCRIDDPGVAMGAFDEAGNIEGKQVLGRTRGMGDLADQGDRGRMRGTQAGAWQAWEDQWNDLRT